MLGRCSDHAVRASVAPTLRAVHGEPGGAWSRQAIAQLIALVEHVETRAPDASAARRAILAAALDSLADNPLVAVDGSPEQRAADALVAALGRDDEYADAVRSVLRPVLVTELDDELASTMDLMDGFRGRVRGA